MTGNKLKVKDLKFGPQSHEAGIGFVDARKALHYKYLLVEKRSSRSYYVFAQRYKDELPCANYRVSANMYVEDLFNEIINRK